MTGIVFTENEATVCPAATVIDAGGVTAPLLLARLTVMPPTGATLLSVTCPVADAPPFTTEGVTLTDTSDGAVTVRDAVCEVPFNCPVMVAITCPLTGVVVMLKVALVLPAATVTVAGVTATTFVEDKLTTTPPAGDGPFNVTVPVEAFPPPTELGESVRLAGRFGVMLRAAETGDIPIVAEMLADVEAGTARVVTVKVAEVEPAAIITLEGTVALTLSEERMTTAPPVAAGPDSVTVPVEDVPLITEVGESVRFAGSGGASARIADADIDSTDAVIVAETYVGTGLVVIGNVADVCPAVTVTVAGTTVLGSLELKLTTVPPSKAGPLSVTDPVEGVPPVTELGSSNRPVGAGGVTVSVAVTEETPDVAVITAFTSAVS